MVVHEFLSYGAHSFDSACMEVLFWETERYFKNVEKKVSEESEGKEV